MEEYFEKSIQMIKKLNKKLSRKQYYKLAKKFDLLSPESLEYISQKEFDKIINENIV